MPQFNQYNAVMNVFSVVAFGIGLLSLSSQSNVAGVFFLITMILGLVLSFFLLMRIYRISFGATVWLTTASWGGQRATEWLFGLFF